MDQNTLLLFEYHSWANKQILEYLKTLPPELFLQPLNSSFPTISHTLYHIYMVDQTWYLRLLGQNPNHIASDCFAGLDRADEAFSSQDEQIRFFLGGALPDKIISYTNTKGDVFQNTVHEVIQHMMNHGTYHRGNLTTMLRQLNIKGVATDFIMFLRKGHH